MSDSPNPVFEENGQWYFWNETWSDKHGPYVSQQSAEEELMWYMVETLGI